MKSEASWEFVVNSSDNSITRKQNTQSLIWRLYREERGSVVDAARPQTLVDNESGMFSPFLISREQAKLGMGLHPDVRLVRQNRHAWHGRSRRGPTSPSFSRDPSSRFSITLPAMPPK